MSSRALLLCNNYVGTDAELRGCFADGERLKAALVSAGAVPEGRVRVLREASAADAVAALEDLARRSREERLAYVFIAYSGHGTQVRDADGDEADGLDEAICPGDFETAGVVSDDLLRRVFAGFYYRTSVVFVCDACHSGSMLDLRFSYDGRRCADAGAASDVGRRVLMISGCRDSQTSADAFLGGTRYGGALTDCLLRSLRDVPEARGDVFRLVHETSKRLGEGGFDQVPVLSSSFLIPKRHAFMPDLKARSGPA
ncbi:peptidase C14, caspase domain-containing protein [Tribonema minus]|uniref:Peptidase C14, caspase domain-containing protein n=1 Tax=Tribonema minus TaxID=303371 RepID=A0A835YX28_9STRA|nr:peptidase C14, caspase domain-containing protein [Tribonema minus]